METSNFNSWWGRQALEPHRTGLWQLGPLTLWIQRLAHQWRITWKHGPDWLDSSVRVVPNASLIPGQETPPSDAYQVNCVFGSSPRQDLLFVPALPDRPVIARLMTPLYILPNETIRLFVVCPLRLRIEMADPQKLLREISTYRLSDTWFGPMSSAGELCYACTEPAFLDLREVPIRLHCAISAVTVRNSGRDSLRVDRINVPLPRLSLFYSPRTGFWTDAFTLERSNDSEMAVIRLERQPPPEASPSQFVTGPRNAVPESNSMIRAFSALFMDRSAN